MRKENELYVKLWARVFQQAIDDLSYEPPESTRELMAYQDLDSFHHAAAA